MTVHSIKKLDEKVPAAIIAAMPTAGDGIQAPGRVLLCHRDDKYHPYVTWWQNAQDTGCYTGHYFKSLEGAKYDFAHRCRRMVMKHLIHASDSGGDEATY